MRYITMVFLRELDKPRIDNNLELEFLAVIILMTLLDLNILILGRALLSILLKCLLGFSSTHRYACGRIEHLNLVHKHVVNMRASFIISVYAVDPLFLVSFYVDVLI